MWMEMSKDCQGMRGEGGGVRVGGACIANDTQLAHLRPDKCHLTRQLAGITVVTTGNLERFRNGSAE